jgi:serine/threonine-protein kinase
MRAMALCPRCSTDVPTGARFCPGCGAVQSSVSQMPTQMTGTAGGAAPTPSPRPAVSGTIGRLESSASFASAAFQPGQMLSGRYRVIGLLGRGGMGEVYRADDLELSQAVSLKFLGRSLSDRPDMLERFRAEVRNARQVSHPNICRVYDIGEVDGQHFLSMEYVDGEDLSTLLKRIGRLPRAKADEVARQMCAGLAAAHDRGVIHRDLKPSNVMIDGEGRVRITDFGLAVRTADGGAGDVAGTPAYMAPEQFDGRPATAQTDLYSLGLILYEIYTGRRPLDAATWDGWKSQHSQVEPRSPEEIEHDVEEPVARAILRCLEKDPARRPRSALQLAASLPGGDPIAAALAAGETPSPQMVAESGGEGALVPRTAWLLLGGLVAVMVALLALAPAAEDLGLVPLTLGADVLEARAKDVVVKLGYTAPPRDGESWLVRFYEPMRWRAEHEPSTHWRRDYARMGPPLLLAWRQSPRRMAPGTAPRVSADDPPLTVSGMVSVGVDGSGRLNAFAAIPPQVDSSSADAAPAHTAEMFALAGLDTAAFHEVPPVWTPLPAYQTRREWLGSAAWMPGVPLRVCAAWWRERPVSFVVRGPWSRPIRMGTSQVVNQNPITAVTLTLLGILMVVFGIATGRSRLKGGRSDWRGGLRLAGVMIIVKLVRWAVYAHHNLDLGDEFDSFALATAFGILQAFSVFFLYLAVEPVVRRRTPELLIGWARVLQGKFTDPRVGRDVLVGAMFGAASVLVLYLVNALPTWLPFHAQTPIPPSMDAVKGGRVLLGALFGLPTDILIPAFALFGVWFLLRLLLRRALPAAIGLAIVMTLLALGAENQTLEVPGALLQGALIAWVIARHGLLALISTWLMRALLYVTPLPLSPTAPYAFQTVLCLGLVVLVIAQSFRVSLGGRPALSLSLDE